MPKYTYYCPGCQLTYDRTVKEDERDQQYCPCTLYPDDLSKKGTKLIRQRVYPINVHYKRAGFYCTDNPGKS